MVYNLKKMFIKRSVAFLLIFSFVSATFYLPTFAPRAQAFFLFTTDVKVLAKTIVDGIAMATAQRLIDQTVKSTIDWANNGFEGNPVYVTNPKQYFIDIEDGIIGDFIAGSDLGYLCSPFQTQVRLALQKHYVQLNPFQCTLTDVIGNIDAFYNDFSQGGWEGWFSMTQNSSNNPYGAYLDAQVELDSRIAQRVGLENRELDWNQGFLSWSSCVKKNPPAIIPVGNGRFEYNPDAVAGKAEGECIERGPIQTPGTTIKSQLDRVLPAGVEKLITAQHVEQLISSFATGLLNRYVFGSKGLFNREPNRDSTAPPNIPPQDPCEAARELYGDGIDCNPGSPPPENFFENQ